MPAAHAVLDRFTQLLPTALIGRLRRWLLVSNSEMGLPRFLGIALAAAVLLPVAYLALLAIGTGAAPTPRALIAVPFITAFGLVFPMLVLRRRAVDRQEKILKALPDSLDLLTTCVEAGLSLDYAFQRVAERQAGPVADEINRMLREKALGQTRKEALTAMAERIDLPDVNVFVQSVIQAETMGTGISSVLRTQSRQLRIRRRQRAEQGAQTAGPKMVFPLVLFVMPSLFIVILGPVVISAWDGLGGF
jgi:tight adherence protein C